MTRLRFVSALLLLAFLVVHAPPALAQPAPVPLPKPSAFTPIAAQLNQQLQSLMGVTTTGNAANPSAAAQTTSGDSGDEGNSEAEETFGTRALNLLLSAASIVAVQGATFVDNFADLPQASDWLNRQSNDTHLIDRWRESGQDLLVVVGIAFAGGFLLQLLLLPARRHLRRRKPADVMRRFTASLALLATELLPVIFFVAGSLALLNTYETQRLPRFVVLNVVYAITLNRLIILLGQFLLSPRTAALRLVAMTQAQATYVYRWLGFFSFVAVYGYFCVDLAHSVHVPPPAVNAFSSLLGLILVIMTITVIVQKRPYVAVMLRGRLSAAQRDLSPWQSLRLWFARSWHILAIAYLVIGYLVTALEVEGGFAILLRGTVLTFLVFVVTGLALHALARYDDRERLHHSILRFFLRISIWIAAVTGIAAAWGASIPAFLATPFGQRVSGSLFSIGATVVVLALVYGYVSSAVEEHLNRQDGDGRPVQASARMRTLLPMLRNAVFIVFSVIATLVILSEAGLNIGPLLAGAGVIGVAVGFGSQTLVKDFLTGLFIVIENTIAIGDVVKVGDHSGVVEAMSVRTLRIRDSDGAVHILPFSEVGQIVNMSKDFAYALVNIGVSYDTDLRHAMEVLKAVGEELQKDTKYRASIIDPIEVFGVDKLADSAVILQARIRTRPGRQWDVKRALLLRIKERFDQEKIEIPYPTVLQLQKTEK
jgi:small conductance mechanosensitive channel